MFQVKMLSNYFAVTAHFNSPIQPCYHRITI